MARRPFVLLSGAVLALSACTAPATGPVPAQTASAAPRGVETITETDMRARVGFLASDALRGRDTPSPGLDAAAAYLVSEYVRMGLRPAGENGTFYQYYPFPLRGLSLERTRLQVAGPRATRTLRPGTDFYVRGGTAAEVTGGMVFVGTGSQAAPGQAGILRERIAVTVLRGAFTPEFRALRDRQIALAQREGARAAVMILDPSWSRDSIARFHTAVSAPRRTLGEEVGFPHFLISHAAGRDLLRSAGLSLDELWTDAVAGKATDVPLPGITATAGAPIDVLDRSLAPNVVAMIPGRDPALRDEYVVLSAHLDHVGVGTPVNGDSIYNGADDDASGTSALVEVAEAIMADPEGPRRTVVFLHVSGEEKGLLGSEWYSDHPTLPLAQIVANVNVDMIGRNSPDSVVVIGKEYSTLGAMVNAVGARHPELGLVISDDIWPEERFFFRSDHFNFARKEIPALFFFTGVHEDYHRPSDHVEKLDVGKATRIARMIYYTVLDIANADGRPQWDPAGLEEVRKLTR